MTGATRSGMTSVQANGVQLGIERFGREADPLILLLGGTTMLSWPDAMCERLATGGRHVVRYDLRDSGTRPPSTRTTLPTTSGQFVVNPAKAFLRDVAHRRLPVSLPGTTTIHRTG